MADTRYTLIIRAITTVRSVISLQHINKCLIVSLDLGVVNPLFPAVPKLVDGIPMNFFNKEVVTMGSFDSTKAFHCKTFDVFIKKLELYGVLAYHEIYCSGRKRLNR